MIRPALIIAVAAALAACASPTPIHAPVTEVPALTPSRNAAQMNIEIDRWWTHFGDAGLTNLIEEALAGNAELESAVARVREAQATLDVARGAQSPTVDAQFRNGREQRSEIGANPLPPGQPRQVSSHRASLELGYEADFWGKLSSSTAAARSQLLATQWARSAVEWGITASVAEAYFELAAVDRQLQVSEAMRASRAASVDVRRRERAAGAGNEFDLRRAEAELTQTEATLASLARQRAGLERALLLLTGRAPQQFTRLVSSLDEANPLAPVLPQGAAGDLLVRRPDVRQAEAQLAAANSSIAAARAATLPSLRLSGSIGSDARSMSDLFTGPAAIWSLAASLTQPIVDGGRLKARVREEQARGDQAMANYRKVVAGAVLDAREAYEGLELTQQAFFAQRDRVAALARAHALARRGYDNGALPYIDLLDAERNWYQAQLGQVSAYRDQLIGQVAAFKALGGGYVTSGSKS